MKRIFTSLILIILIATAVNAQNPHPFELGFNAGAAWLKSDVKTGKTGSGAGLTFGQTYCMNQTSPLLWGWRFRYLNANTYGQDSKKSYGIANNEVLNGTDTLLDYYNSNGYVYHNYKTHIDELGLEILLGANKLRERTNIYPYIFAGAGLTKATARINQLDDNSKRYNYLKIDSAGNSSSSEVLSQINDQNDATYETLGDGNLRPRWKFMPSVGVGLGFEIIKGFSIGLEHKATWALNDVLDAQRWSDRNASTGNNDMYHYTSFFIKFSFGRGKHKSKPASTTTTTTTDATTLTNSSAVPVIKFTTPSTNPYTSAAPGMTVSGTVANINSASDMTMSVNGNMVSDFTYNSSSKIFSHTLNLLPGSNTITVTATNTNGTANASTAIIYSQPVVVPEAQPVVKITTPAQTPQNTNQNVGSIGGTVQNISDKSQMQIMMNGSVVNDFTYNQSTKAFATTQTLIQGANTFVVSATNQAGSDSKSVTLIYKPEQAQSSPSPIVTITNPAVDPFTTTVIPVTVNATIQNITAAGQIQVQMNGGPIPASKLNYNVSTHKLSFSPNLIQGANTIEVSATNVAGRDAKTITIIYNKPEVQQLPPPVVSFVNPASNPFTTASSSLAVVANILNVTSVGQISVQINGAVLPAGSFNYNAVSHNLSFNANLIQGNNSIIVSANNGNGSDSKTETVIYNQPVQNPPPTVTITNPVSSPSNSSVATTSVTATILNITAAGQIAVLHNGGPIPASRLNYNLITHVLNFNVNLVQGSNTIVVSATNVAGSDSKTTTIIYNKTPDVLPPVITITSPSSNPANVNVASHQVTANVTNVTAVSQISVSLNGSALSAGALNFNATTHQLSFNAQLIQGANSIVVSATNSGGNDTKTQTIIYTLPVAIPAPVITITKPSTNPSASVKPFAAVTATVLNVSAVSQITVTLNGTPLAASVLNFNTATQQLSFNVNLILGSNTVMISAANSSGTDSKSITITHAKPVALIPSPTVTISVPASNPFTTSNISESVTATITNITSASQANVLLNGNALPATGMTYNTTAKQLTFNVNLNLGSNTVVVSATNASGTDSKTQTIIYRKPQAPAPVIIITSPASNPFATTNSSATLNATISNVNTASQVTVMVNGTPTSSFTFNPATQQLSMNVTLIAGSNNITISANNSSGSDSKSQTINYTAPAPAPVITLMNPATGSASVTTNSSVVTAKILNITNTSQISVKVNGSNVSGYTYQPTNQKFSLIANLISGNNTVLITATNGSGSDSKTVTLTYTPEAVNPVNPDTSVNNARPVILNTESENPNSGAVIGAPTEIILINPTTNAVTTSDAVYSVSVKIPGITNPANISVRVNGVAFTGTTFNNKSKVLTIPAPLNMGPNLILIDATNAGVPKIQKINITRQ